MLDLLVVRVCELVAPLVECSYRQRLMVLLLRTKLTKMSTPKVKRVYVLSYFHDIGNNYA